MKTIRLSLETSWKLFRFFLKRKKKMTKKKTAKNTPLIITIYLE